MWSHQREPGNRSTAITVTTHQTVHVILFPRRQRATTASAWRQLGVPSCTSASGCPWYQDNTSPEEVIPLHVRENTRKKREGTGATTRPSLEPGENPSGERGGRGAWNEDMCRKKRCRWRWEREGTISPRSPSRELAADEGVAGRRARGRGKGDGWWKQTGAAVTRRVSRSLCRAWKKRGEGRGSSKAAGKAGSSTHGWRATSAAVAVWWLFLTRRCPLLGEHGRPFSSLEERRWPLASLDRSVGSCWVYEYAARARVCVCIAVCVLSTWRGWGRSSFRNVLVLVGDVVIFCLRYSVPILREESWKLRNRWNSCWFYDHDFDGSMCNCSLIDTCIVYVFYERTKKIFRQINSTIIRFE